jgi:hypothetical protein
MAANRYGAGVRSGSAVPKDAELVSLWVGKYDPALIASLADVGMSGTKVEQAADLFLLPPVDRADVDVEPVLGGLGLRHLQEDDVRHDSGRARSASPQGVSVDRATSAYQSMCGPDGTIKL